MYPSFYVRFLGCAATAAPPKGRRTGLLDGDPVPDRDDFGTRMGVRDRMQLNLLGFLGFQSEDPSIEPLCNTRWRCCWAERRDLVFLTVRWLGWRRSMAEEGQWTKPLSR